MQSAAAGWLMTVLSPDAFVVSLVQVAASFPMFLFALPAGALADIIDHTARERRSRKNIACWTSEHGLRSHCYFRFGVKLPSSRTFRHGSF